MSEEQAVPQSGAEQAANPALEHERQMLRDVEERGGLAKIGGYLRLSGPGFLQSALTLGGGSLAGSLYLGILAGPDLLWLQPFAMILGIVMLSAIAYVTMSTQERPFRSLNTHVNPVLGWGWALASLTANMVWALSQYSLATGALQQNLFPGVLGPDSPMGDFSGKLLISISLLLIAIAITWSYDRGGRGVKVYETILKLMVAMIVICFFGVVLKLALTQDGGGIIWSEVFRGFIPRISSITTPAPRFAALLQNIPTEHVAQWTEIIVAKQRDVLIGAAATAVGINMTFLFPYSILRRGWTKEFRGFAKFDLGMGMLIPFVLATSCVIIAAGSQFHAKPAQGFFDAPVEEGVEVPQASTRHLNEYYGYLVKLLPAGSAADGLGDFSDEELLARVGSFRESKWFEGMQADLLKAESRLKARQALENAIRVEALPEGTRYLAATLVTRDAFDLAKSLRPFTGPAIADWAFGLGVVGMTLSTITLLMLVSGFVICEIFNVPATGWPYRLGTLCAATGALGPFFWNKAQFWLAVPTSVFCFILMPIAYWAFTFMMNQRKLLKDEMPTGGRRVAWNVLMIIAATVMTVASLITVYDKAAKWGMAAVIAFILLVVIVHIVRKLRSKAEPSA